MEFEWDADKRLANYAKHEVDFLLAVRIFEGATVDRADTRRDYGEDRVISTGLVDGVVYVVVWTDRTEARRIISAWKAGKSEREAYRAILAGRNSRDH